MNLSKRFSPIDQLRELLSKYNHLDSEDKDIILKLLHSYFIDKSSSFETKKEIVKNMMIPLYIPRNLREKEIILHFYKYINEGNQSIPLFRWIFLRSKEYNTSIISIYELLERFTFGISLYSNLVFFHRWHSKRKDILRLKLNNLLMKPQN